MPIRADVSTVSMSGLPFTALDVSELDHVASKVSPAAPSACSTTSADSPECASHTRTTLPAAVRSFISWRSEEPRAVAVGYAFVDAQRLPAAAVPRRSWFIIVRLG